MAALATVPAQPKVYTMAKPQAPKQAQQPKQAQPASPMPTLATLGTPQPATPQPAPQVLPVAYTSKTGQVVQAVALTPVAYKVSAPHNVAWWQAVQAAVAAGQGVATVQALAAAGVPLHFVRYAQGRGHLAPAALPQVA